MATDHEDGKHFWSFNNGLTIICNKVDDLPDDKYRLHGLQIVNGCQTSNTLYHAYINWEKRDRLLQKEKDGTELSKEERNEIKKLEDNYLDDKVTLLVKIIETKDFEQIYKITETTNTQTAIKVFSLKANEDIHKNIEQYLLEHNIYYERRINYYKNQGKAPIIDIPGLAQAYYSIILRNPSIARGKPHRLFESSYENIFPDTDKKEMDYKLYLISVIIYQRTMKQIRTIQRRKIIPDSYKTTILSNGKLHLSCLVLYQIIEPLFKEKDIIANFSKIQNVINDESSFSSIFENALDTLEKLLKNVAGTNKAVVPAALRKPELDTKIKKFITTKKI